MRTASPLRLCNLAALIWQPGQCEEKESRARGSDESRSRRVYPRKYRKLVRDHKPESGCVTAPQYGNWTRCYNELQIMLAFAAPCCWCKNTLLCTTRRDVYSVKTQIKTDLLRVEVLTMLLLFLHFIKKAPCSAVQKETRVKRLVNSSDSCLPSQGNNEAVQFLYLWFFDRYTVSNVQSRGL